MKCQFNDLLLIKLIKFLKINKTFMKLKILIGFLVSRLTEKADKISKSKVKNKKNNILAYLKYSLLIKDKRFFNFH